MPGSKETSAVNVATRELLDAIHDVESMPTLDTQWMLMIDKLVKAALSAQPAPQPAGTKEPTPFTPVPLTDCEKRMEDPDYFGPAETPASVEQATIAHIKAHWFTQGGTARFRAIEGNNADELVASILALLADPRQQTAPPTQGCYMDANGRHMHHFPGQWGRCACVSYKEPSPPPSDQE